VEGLTAVDRVEIAVDDVILNCSRSCWIVGFAVQQLVIVVCAIHNHPKLRGILDGMG
tara:strand:+ start:385 stop:555 length:171 start_codon:yes stop_codon:yes gene_type:complete